MRRLLTWTAGVLSIAALARLLRRRERRDADAQAPQPADPAADLRQKLAETRDDHDVVDDPRPGDESAADAAESIEQRRARVHAKAQEAIDEMKAGDP